MSSETGDSLPSPLRDVSPPLNVESSLDDPPSPPSSSASLIREEIRKAKAQRLSSPMVQANSLTNTSHAHFRRENPFEILFRTPKSQKQEIIEPTTSLNDIVDTFPKEPNESDEDNASSMDVQKDEGSSEDEDSVIPNHVAPEGGWVNNVRLRELQSVLHPVSSLLLLIGGWRSRRVSFRLCSRIVASVLILLSMAIHFTFDLYEVFGPYSLQYFEPPWASSVILIAIMMSLIIPLTVRSSLPLLFEVTAWSLSECGVKGFKHSMLTEDTRNFAILVTQRARKDVEYGSEIRRQEYVVSERENSLSDAEISASFKSRSSIRSSANSSEPSKTTSYEASALHTMRERQMKSMKLIRWFIRLTPWVVFTLALTSAGILVVCYGIDGALSLNSGSAVVDSILQVPRLLSVVHVLIAMVYSLYVNLLIPIIVQIIGNMFMKTMRTALTRLDETVISAIMIEYRRVQHILSLVNRKQSLFFGLMTIISAFVVIVNAYNVLMVQRRATYIAFFLVAGIIWIVNMLTLSTGTEIFQKIPTTLDQSVGELLVTGSEMSQRISIFSDYCRRQAPHFGFRVGGFFIDQQLFLKFFLGFWTFIAVYIQSQILNT